ncbi:MAG: DUF1553 domain-containing protein [Verrucomicrobiales bacterium]
MLRIGAIALLSLSTGICAQPTHWAYRPVRGAALPGPKVASWPRNAIDVFVLDDLEQDHRVPAPAAPGGVLLRRLHFAIVGLPPTVEALDRFGAVATPDAVAEEVERLLSSPRFGEHWARHWLDVARFGQSLTLRGFIFKEAWRYRDYVIDAFNRDLPFDQFVREQLAGDLLPHASLAEHQRHLVATTFLALGNTNLEEQDKKQLDMDVVDEQLDTIGKAFLAQTIGCARCHDHKFDPIPTRDYYALAGILKNAGLLEHDNVSKWLEVPMPVVSEEEAVYRASEAEIAALEQELKTAQKAAGSKGIRAGPVAVGELPGVVVDSARTKVVGVWKHSQFHKSYIGDGYLHDDREGKGTKTLTFQPEGLQGGRYEVRLAYVPGDTRAPNVPITVFHAEGETTISVDQRILPPVEGRWVALGQFRFEPSGFCHVLVSNEGTTGHVTADAVQFLPLDRAERAGAAASGDGNITKSLEAKLKRVKASAPARPKVMTVVEREKIEDSPVHKRGSVHSLGELVPRGFLSCVKIAMPKALPNHQSGRRELADWISSPQHPLTARVIVNRVWLWLFGRGLVATPDNFGTTGSLPTHPEMLDLLTAQFIGHAWSIKWLVREIVTSQTWQMGVVADVTDRSDTKSTMAGRRRLSAEELRDAMLAVSGKLSLEMGGPNHPPDLTADFNYQDNSPRRSVYVPVFRNSRPDLFEAFDAPSPSMVTGQRDQSSVVTQALFLLNHPFVTEQAQAAARRLLQSESEGTSARVNWAWRQCLGRGPSGAELDEALAHLGERPSETEWAQLFLALFASIDFRYVE